MMEKSTIDQLLKQFMSRQNPELRQSIEDLVLSEPGGADLLKAYEKEPDKNRGLLEDVLSNAVKSSDNPILQLILTALRGNAGQQSDREGGQGSLLGGVLESLAENLLDKPKPRRKIRPKAKPKSKTSSSTRPKSKMGTKSKPKTSTSTRPKTKSGTKAKPKTKTGVKTRPKTQPKSKAKPRTKTKSTQIEVEE